MLEYWIWLSLRLAVGNHLKGELVRHFGSAKAVYLAERSELRPFPAMKPRGLDSLMDKDMTPVWDILDQCTQEGLHILTQDDAQYPERLLNIYDPPVVLYYKGRLPDFSVRPSIGIVGTRKCTSYGAETAHRLGYEISRCGGLVVSGLAEGVDAAAMHGALQAGMPTVGVLGCGADRIYPPCNESLFRDVERFGCILSEYAPGTPPIGRNFPARNRIISGLSCGIAVVEAPERSGSLITVRDALDQGRDVFVVPGNLDNPNFAGSNRLLREGGIAVATGWDVVGEYAARFPNTVHPFSGEIPRMPLRQTPAVPKPAPKPRPTAPKTSKKPASEEKAIDKGSCEPYIDLCEILKGLSPDEQAVVRAIGTGERPVDDVIDETGIQPGKLLGLLTVLEIRGILTRLPGRRIALKAKT